MLTLIIFILALMLVTLANLGEGYDWARRLTVFLLLVASIAFLLAGAFAPLEMLEDRLLPGLEPDFDAVRRWLALSGLLSSSIIAALLFLARGDVEEDAANASERDARVHIMFRRWARPVHLTALTLIILYTGANLAQAAMISDPSVLLESDVRLGMGALLSQEAGFLAMALLGVGLGLRRSWPETLERLKLHALSVRDVASAFWLVILLITLSVAAGSILMLFAPQDSIRAAVFNQLIMAEFQSLWGAILLGLLSGFGEELLYRGALQPTLGLVLTSLVFALHHLQYLNPTLIVIFLLGLALGWIRNRWSTTLAALVHAGYNTSLMLFALAAASTVGG